MSTSATAGAASRWRGGAGWRGGVLRYAGATLLLAAATSLAALFDVAGLDETNLALSYIPSVAASAAWFGRGPAVWSALGSVVLFNFFFTAPRYTLAVHDPRAFFTFAVLLGIGLVVSELTARLEERSSALVALALEREQSSERARRAQVEVEAEKLRASLLSSISHDLRTPLAVITGASSSLLEADDSFTPTERRELVETIFDESDRLCQIVEDLLHLTRLTSERPVLRKEWQVVEDIVGSALHRSAAALAAHEIELDVPDALPMIAVDGVLLELLLINLLENAAKYSPRGSTVTVTARAGPAVVALEVSDRGKGLSAEEQARAFEAFYRGPGASVRGTGLGLTICRAISTLHGGTLTVTDRPGGGSTFRLELPLEAQPPELAGGEEQGADLEP